MNEMPNHLYQEEAAHEDSLTDTDIQDFGLGAALQLVAGQWFHPTSPEYEVVADATTPLQGALQSLYKTRGPDQREQLEGIETKIVLLIEAIATPFFREKENRQKGQQSSKKAAVQNRAWHLADDLWEADPTIRMGEVCRKLWEKLIDEGYKDVLPESEKGIKAWIKDAAPKSASRRGRPSKNEK